MVYAHRPPWYAVFNLHAITAQLPLIMLNAYIIYIGSKQRRIITLVFRVHPLFCRQLIQPTVPDRHSFLIEFDERPMGSLKQNQAIKNLKVVPSSFVSPHANVQFPKKLSLNSQRVKNIWPYFFRTFGNLTLDMFTPRKLLTQPD